jgi:hypothetical protein
LLGLGRQIAKAGCHVVRPKVESALQPCAQSSAYPENLKPQMSVILEDSRKLFGRVKGIDFDPQRGNCVPTIVILFAEFALDQAGSPSRAKKASNRARCSGLR